MNSFEINLIKGRVPLPEKRKIIFLSIILYLAACSLVLVFLCYSITANFVKLSYDKRQLGRIEKEVSGHYSQGRSMFNYASDMKAEIGKHIDTIETISSVLQKRVNLAILVRSFFAVLPSGAYIDNFMLDSAGKRLSFNVIMPAGSIETVFDASELISAWKNNASLMSNIDRIELVMSQRQKIGEESMFISEFSCSLSKGGL